MSDTTKCEECMGGGWEAVGRPCSCCEGTGIAAPTTPPPTWGKIRSPTTWFDAIEAPCGCHLEATNDRAVSISRCGWPCPAHSFADLVEGEKRLRRAQNQGEKTA